MKNISKTILCGFIAATALSATAASNEGLEHDRVKAEFKIAKDRCDGMKGNQKDVCIAQAEADRDKADAKIKAEYKPSAKATRDMREAYADADYKVAKEKCDDFTGNEKDVCTKQAKATHTTAIENAKTNKEMVDLTNNATDKRNDAQYSVEREKCDAFTGAMKDKCIAEAKLNHAK